MLRVKILVVSLLFLSCSRVDTPKEQFLQWAKKGVVVDNVACKLDATLTYCLYLPSNYDLKKSYPTIYAFDPHGKGAIPVGLLKDVAEKLGYIVVGSNNSRNGLSPNEINRIVNILMSDSEQKISIDKNRIYTVGFSGGARVACMIAQSNLGVKGVISCSAGFQSDGKPIGFKFIGIAGTQDMNYLEVKQVCNYLQVKNQPHQFLVYDGKHQWPPESVLNEAVNLLDLWAMKDTLVQINKSNIETYFINTKNRIAFLEKSDSPDSLALALSYSKRVIEMLNGFLDVKSVKDNIADLEKNKTLQNYLAAQSDIEKYEVQKQGEFLSAFGIKSDAWWKSEIEQLNQSVSLSKNKSKVDVSKRLLGFISLNCYGYVNSALHYKDWKTATYFTSIYRQVDPDNPDSWYALACLQANSDKPKEAIKSLKMAIQFGFNDFAKMRNDPLLSRIRGLEDYISLLKK